jgi:hypothetical protein
MTSTPWNRPALQRSLVGSAIFGTLGTFVVGWGFGALTMHWLYWVLALLCAGAVWGAAVGVVRRAVVESRAEDRRVSPSALGFQLTLIGVALGSAGQLVPGLGVSALCVVVAASFAWTAAALTSARESGFARESPGLGNVSQLQARLRHLARGIPTKDADPIGCVLSLVSLIALGWLGFVVWLAVDVVVPLVARLVFTGPTRLSLHWVPPSHSIGKFLLACTSWTSGFSVVLFGAYFAAGMAR